MIYKVLCEDDYEIINPVNQNDYDLLRLLNGTPKKNMWKDFTITFESADKGKKKKPSDFPWYMSTVLILKEHVVTKMQDFFLKNGELLPIHSTDNQRLYAFNCNVINALDEQKSDIIRLQSTGKIVLVKKIVFKNEENIQNDIFRLNYNASPTFVTDRFVNMYKEFNFKGLKFVDSSEIALK